MKRSLHSIIVLFVLLAIPASHTVLAHNHVPPDELIVCVLGKTIITSPVSVDFMRTLGICCQLPACDFNNVYRSADSCPFNNIGGKCDLPNERSDAGGTSLSCPAGTY